MSVSRVRPWIQCPDGRTFRGIWPQNLSATGEGPYIAELARQINGVAEVTLPAGRADVATGTHVFEVEPVKSWREGARQAFSYAGMTGLMPVVALFGAFEALPLYLKIRDRMPPLELWCWTWGRWEHIGSRREASRKIRFIDLKRDEI